MNKFFLLRYRYFLGSIIQLRLVLLSVETAAAGVRFNNCFISRTFFRRGRLAGPIFQFERIVRMIGEHFSRLAVFPFDIMPAFGAHRSEEHTSELQSLRHLVCRLLLE